MYSFPSFESVYYSSPIVTVASWPAYWFLRRQGRWSGIPISFRIFQFVVIHTVKGFGILNKAEVDVFLELSCFLMIQWMLAIWSLVPLPFLNPAWIFGSSRFTFCWSLAWRICGITLLGCEMSTILQWFEHSLAFPFFGIGMKKDPFQSYGHCWLFQMGWHIECSTLTASYF